MLNNQLGAVAQLNNNQNQYNNQGGNNMTDDNDLMNQHNYNRMMNMQ